VSAPGLTFTFGRGAVTLAADGRILGVRADAGDSPSYLAGGGDVVVNRPGGTVAWSSPTLSADIDEVEYSFCTAAGLGLVVRHSFGAGWGIRIALTNQGDDDLALQPSWLSWEPSPDHLAWVLAAGATGTAVIQPPDGAGPLLGGRLTMGSCDFADSAGLGFGPLMLAPGARYVISWQWDWYRSPRAFDHGMSLGVPRRFYLPVDQSVAIASDLDEAVVAPGVHLERVRGQLELSSAVAGRFAVAVSSARGVTRFAVEWVDSREVRLAAAADEVMGQPASAAGVIQLADVDAALVIQWAVTRGVMAHPYPAEDALEVFTAGVAETGVADPRVAAFFCGEFERTGDGELVELATRWLLQTSAVQPGLGLAGTRICLARILLGRPVAPVTDHLARLAGTSGPARSLFEQAAALELSLLTMAHPAPSRHEVQRVTAALTTLGPWLGAGLKGRPVHPLGPDALSYLAAVLALTSEELSTAMRRRWGVSARELGEDVLAQALAGLAGEPIRPAHGWLVLGGPAVDGGG
jgi:hypothetical protein